MKISFAVVLFWSSNYPVSREFLHEKLIPKRKYHTKWVFCYSLTKTHTIVYAGGGSCGGAVPNQQAWGLSVVMWVVQRKEKLAGR